MGRGDDEVFTYQCARTTEWNWFLWFGTVAQQCLQKEGKWGNAKSCNWNPLIIDLYHMRSVIVIVADGRNFWKRLSCFGIFGTICLEVNVIQWYTYVRINSYYSRKTLLLSVIGVFVVVILTCAVWTDEITVAARVIVAQVILFSEQLQLITERIGCRTLNVTGN